MKISAVRIENFKSFAASGQVDLADINVIVGRNNSGKSAFIRAIGLLQTGLEAVASDVRLGTDRGTVQFYLVGTQLGADIKRHFGFGGNVRLESATLTMNFAKNGPNFDMPTSSLVFDTVPSNEVGVSRIGQQEPNSFIYNYLSKRKVVGFEQAIDRRRTITVASDLRYLVPKVDRLANQDHGRSAEYTKLCNKVLGFRVSAHASESGKQAGIPVGDVDYIAVEAMGEGVSSLLGLITDLCMANGNLFLIEELENDIHPEGLKALLDVIVEKSEHNQFIISTHSNIVVKHLGSASNSRLFAVDLKYSMGEVPTSTIREIEPTPEARIAVLRELGYELYDFDLWEGWLILEEASAEVIIRDYLIRWFAPHLSRVRTLAAGGTGKVEATFEDFWRLFLFVNLQKSPYEGRAWVVVDGDPSGEEVIKQLQGKYKTWPAEHFRTFGRTDFEYYYPERFAEKAAEALGKKDKKAKQNAKKVLCDEVKKWCDEFEDEAKVEFELSAGEVISLLKEIEQTLLGDAH